MAEKGQIVCTVKKDKTGGAPGELQAGLPNLKSSGRYYKENISGNHF